MTINLTAHQARLLRMRSQQLSTPRPEQAPEEVLRQIFAVQAQDLPASYLSLRARSGGFTADQVAYERQNGSEICWRWSLRGTLHLITVEDARWLIPLLSTDLVAWDRLRLTQLGYTEKTAQKGVEVIRRAIEQHGELTRDEIAQLLKDHSLPFVGQATVHILFRAVCEGDICPGVDRGKKPTYTQFEKRYGALEPRPRLEALTELALRYLAAYGPARPEDFAAWSGVKISEARPLWQSKTDQILPVEIEGTPNWILKSQATWLESLESQPPVLRLLPRFDTYLLGYANRDLLIDPSFNKKLFKGGGTISAVVVLDGWVIGVWKTKARGKALELTVEWFNHQPDRLMPSIEAEAADIARFLTRPVTVKIQQP
ncbi:MAG: winged helix DNA-binding domain-containing protein [Bellilinea sp.]